MADALPLMPMGEKTVKNSGGGLGKSGEKEKEREVVDYWEWEEGFEREEEGEDIFKMIASLKRMCYFSFIFFHFIDFIFSLQPWNISAYMLITINEGKNLLLD